MFTGFFMIVFSGILINYIGVSGAINFMNYSFMFGVGGVGVMFYGLFQYVRKSKKHLQQNVNQVSKT